MDSMRSGTLWVRVFGANVDRGLTTPKRCISSVVLASAGGGEMERLGSRTAVLGQALCRIPVCRPHGSDGASRGRSQPDIRLTALRFSPRWTADAAAGIIHGQ